MANVDFSAPETRELLRKGYDLARPGVYNVSERLKDQDIDQIDAEMAALVEELRPPVVSVLFGLPPRDLHGRCFFDFEAGNAHIANRRFLALLKRNGEIRDYVTHVVTARGDSRWIGINARTLLDEAVDQLGGDACGTKAADQDGGPIGGARQGIGNGGGNFVDHGA